MPVVQAEDGMRVEPDHVYVIPPNAYLSIRERMLRLTPPTAPRSLRMAVDFFLRSLAEDQRERAIGIVLSGTGTDGTLGLKEIKAAGGMTMVQDPQTAQHDGMPRSAIASGCADHVLPAEQMGDALLAYVRSRVPSTNGRHGTADGAERADSLARIVALLRTEQQVRLQRLQDRHAAPPHPTPHEPAAHRPDARVRRAAAQRPGGGDARCSRTCFSM